MGVPRRSYVVERLHAGIGSLGAQQGQQRNHIGVVTEPQRGRKVRFPRNDAVGRLDDIAQQRPGIGDERIAEAGRRSHD